jgi:hypothetical protein
MKGLTLELQQLIAAEKTGLAAGPSAVDAGLGALLSAVDSGATPSVDIGSIQLTTVSAKAVAFPLAGKLVALLAATGIAGAGAGVWLRSQAPSAESVGQRPAAAVASSQPTSKAAAPEPTPTAQAAPARPALSAAKGPVPRAVRESDSDAFSSELRLIQKAQSALTQGDEQLARSLLSEHQSEFPRGQFAQDRSALSALVKCRFGPVEQGRAEARAFVARMPKSVYVDRLRSVCLSEK